MGKQINIQKLRPQLLAYLKQFEANPKLVSESTELINDLRNANIFDVLPKDIQEGLDALGTLCFQPECVDPAPTPQKLRKLIQELQNESKE